MDPKIEVLEKAFARALQSLDQGVGDSDIQECFGDLKVTLGAALQRSVMNMMNRTVEKMNNTFLQINDDFDLANQISNYNNISTHKVAVDMPNSEEEDTIAAEKRMKEVRIALKRAEIEELTISMRVLEGEIKKLKEQSGRLTTQLANEVDTLDIENLKLKHASEGLGSL